MNPQGTTQPELENAGGKLGPTCLVAAEFMRALGSLLLLPWRVASYWLRRKALRARFQGDLDSAPFELDPSRESPWSNASNGQSLTVFVSSAEASGEGHAAELIQALRQDAHEHNVPPPRFVGLGGDKLRSLGVELCGDPVSRAAMGSDVLGQLPFYMRILRDSACALRDLRPSVLVAVDSPALHVPLGRLAKHYGIPVVHYVTPQYWGWAPWRVRGYKKAVDRALTILPFEPAWFERHGVSSVHVGHPIQDHLAAIKATRPAPDSQCVALLPGSRNSVIERNLPWMLDVVGELAQTRPHMRVLLSPSSEAQAPRLRAIAAAAGLGETLEILPAGQLHEILSRARIGFSVSGTALLDTLHHRLPTVVIYRLSSSLQEFAYRNFLTASWFSSVNLLAGRELLPEFCFYGAGPKNEVLRALERAWDDPDWRRETGAGLDLAAERLGPPGAAQRAAREVVGAMLPSK